MMFKDFLAIDDDSDANNEEILKNIVSEEELRKAVLEQRATLTILLLLRGVRFNIQNLLDPGQARIILTYLHEKPTGSDKTRMEMLKDMISFIETQNPNFTLKLTKALVTSISDMQANGVILTTKINDIKDFIDNFSDKLAMLLQKEPLQQESAQKTQYNSVLKLISGLDNGLSKNFEDKPHNENLKAKSELEEASIELHYKTPKAKIRSNELPSKEKFTAVEHLLTLTNKGHLLPDFIKLEFDDKGNKLWQIKGEALGLPQNSLVSLQDLNKDQLEIISNKLAESIKSNGGFAAKELQRRIESSNMQEALHR